MLQAKLKQEYRFGGAIQALSGREFVKSEWRDVPEGYEEQAQAHEWLETREAVIEGAIETLTPAPKAGKVVAKADAVMDEMLTNMAQEMESEDEPEQKRKRKGRQ